MTEQAATGVGADGTPRGNEFYGSGPWLIAFGHGPESEARATCIAEQCRARGVDFDLTTADEVEAARLRFYMALTMVLPAAAAGAQARSLTDLVQLVRSYRARRTAGLSALDNGSRWFEVGVVQVFDDAAGPRRGALEPVLHLVCRYHRLESGVPPQPFACYEQLGEPGRPNQPDLPPAGSPFTDSVEILRATLRRWGVAWERREVIRIRQCVDDLRELWEKPAFYDLHRPVGGISRNRLDFLLDDPAYAPPEDICSHKKWMEGGQRVVGRVLDELQATFPNVHRPHGRDGKKGKQKDFQDFYLALRAAEEILPIRRPPT